MNSSFYVDGLGYNDVVFGDFDNPGGKALGQLGCGGAPGNFSLTIWAESIGETPGGINEDYPYGSNQMTFSVGTWDIDDQKYLPFFSIAAVGLTGAGRNYKNINVSGGSTSGTAFGTDSEGHLQSAEISYPGGISTLRFWLSTSDEAGTRAFFGDISSGLPNTLEAIEYNPALYVPPTPTISEADPDENGEVTITYDLPADTLFMVIRNKGPYREIIGWGRSAGIGFGTFVDHIDLTGEILPNSGTYSYSIATYEVTGDVGSEVMTMSGEESPSEEIEYESLADDEDPEVPEIPQSGVPSSGTGGVTFGVGLAGSGGAVNFGTDPSGIYTLTVDKHTDTLINRTEPVTYDIVAIPTPFIKTGYIP